MAIQRIRSDQHRQGDSSVRRRAATVSLATFALVAVGLTAVPSAGAATFPVTNLDDAGTGSLRAAVSAANSSPGTDVIAFDPGLTGTLALTTGEVVISEGVTISGPGASKVTIDAGGASRVFDIHTDALGAAAVTVAGLTLTGGTAPPDPAAVTPGDLLDGGAIVASSSVPGSLTLNGVTLTGNTGGDGGAVQVRGVALTLTGSTLSGNTAQFGGGGIRAFNSEVQVIDTTMTGNSAALAGGALRVSGGHLTLQGSAVQNNVAGSAGGIRAAVEATVTIEDSTISGNTANGVGVTGNGGGLVLDDLTTGSSTIRNTLISGNTAAANAGGAEIGAGAVSLTNVTVVGNTSANSGGGIRFNGGATTMTGATVTGNSAVHGGGILSTGPGALVRNSILAGNTATDAAERDLTVNSVPDDGPVKLDYVLVETPPVPGASTTVTAGATILGQDPGLEPLADNGGTTETRRPAANSPVIDKGKSFGSAEDQRGRPRPVDLAAVPNRAGGDAADLGAVELSSATDALPVANTSRPTIAGTARYGSALTATSTGTWSPGGATLSRQWLRNGTPVPGAVGPTYLLGLADLGTRISLRVEATLTGFAPGSATSLPTATVAKGLLTTSGTGRIAGILKVARTLTAMPPAARPAATTRYQWLRNGTAIGGASRAKYVLRKADQGKRISVRVTLSRAGYADKVMLIKRSGLVRKRG